MNRSANRPNRLTIDFVRDFLKENNLTLLSTEYWRLTDKLEVLCSCGKAFKRGFDKIYHCRQLICNYCSRQGKIAKLSKPELTTCPDCGGKKSHRSKRCSSCNGNTKRQEGKGKYKKSRQRYSSHIRNPNWQGGSAVWWRREVIKKYRAVCACCGYSGLALNAHHLYSKSERKDLAMLLANGVCLCANCHYEFHTIYGQKRNTPRQYIEFKRGKENGWNPRKLARSR